MSDLIRIEDLPADQHDGTVDVLLALWIALMKKIGMHPNSIPATKAELNIMHADVEKLLQRFKKYSLDQITVCLNEGATAYANEIAERATTVKPIFATVTIGHLNLWLRKLGPVPDYDLKALEGDGLTPAQRAAGWKSKKEINRTWEGDPLEVARAKAPQMLDDCANGGAYRVKSLLMHADNAEIFKAIVGAIPAEVMATIKADTMMAWRSKVLAENPAAKFKDKTGKELRPAEVLENLVKRHNRKGGNGDTIRRYFPDYQALGIAPILRAFLKTQKITKMEVEP